MVFTSLGSSPAAAMLCANRPALGPPAWPPPVPESISTSRPAVLTARMVNGIGTKASVSPAALSSALVCSTLAPLMKFSSCGFSQTPSKSEITSMSPTWFFLKPGPGGTVCACAAPMKASGLSRANAAKAPAAPTTRSRRETWNMGLPLGSGGCWLRENGGPAAPALPGAVEVNPGDPAPHRGRRAVHGFVMTVKLYRKVRPVNGIHEVIGTRMNVNEYLAWAQSHPGRYELRDGEVVARSPEGAGHAAIKFAVQSALLAGLP